MSKLSNSEKTSIREALAGMWQSSRVRTKRQAALTVQVPEL